MQTAEDSSSPAGSLQRNARQLSGAQGPPPQEADRSSRSVGAWRTGPSHAAPADQGTAETLVLEENLFLSLEAKERLITEIMDETLGSVRSNIYA